MRQGEMQRFAEQLLALALDCPVLVEPVCRRVGPNIAEEPGNFTDELAAVAMPSNN